MGVPGGVGMEMADRFSNQMTMVAGWQAFEMTIGHLEVVERIRRFIRARRLRRRTDVIAREKIGKRRVMLPIAKERRDPARTREERIPRRRRSSKEQMVTAAGARLLVRAELFERAESDAMRH